MKIICPECEGIGIVRQWPTSTPDFIEVQCQKCSGTGIFDDKDHGGVTLADLREIIEKMVKADDDLSRAEEAVKKAKETSRKYHEEIVPGLMEELEMTSLELETGEIVKVKPYINASITEAKKPEAFAWLEKNGYEGIIKTEVVVQFDREDYKKALAFYKRIIKRNPAFKQSVHSQTLKAFVTERLEQGTPDFPMDLFGVYEIVQATIEKAKAPSKRSKAKKEVSNGTRPH